MRILLLVVAILIALLPFSADSKRARRHPMVRAFARTQGLQTNTVELDRFTAQAGAPPYSTDLSSLLGASHAGSPLSNYTITPGVWEDNVGGDCVPLGQTQAGVEFQLNEAGSQVWAKALGGYLGANPALFAEARTRLLEFAATTGFEIADLSGGNQCILDLGSAAYHVFEAAWLLEDAGYSGWTAADKAALADWAATQVFPLVSWGIESRKNNWGIVTYGSALAAAAYVDGHTPLLTLYNSTTTTPAAYLSETTRLTKWLSASVGNQLDSACDPTYVFGLQSYGGFPDDVRRPSTVSHPDCAAVSIAAHSTQGGCTSSTVCAGGSGHFYQQKSTNNFARVCEIMRRIDGNGARCFGLTSHGGDQESLRDAAQFATGGPTYNTWLVQDTTQAFRFVAGEYYADAALISALDSGGVSVRGGHDYAYTRITHAPGVAYVGSSYTWSLGDLAAYDSRIPLLAAHDWSNDLDTQAEVEAAWTGETTVTIQATNCDAAGVGSDQDRAVIQNELTNNKVVILSNADSGGAQSPCYYDFSTQMGGSYDNLAIIGQSATTTILNYDVQPANRTTNVANALQLGTEVGQTGSPIAYTGSLAQGDTTAVVASGTWAVNSPVVVESTDGDADHIEFSTFLTAVSGTAPTITLTFNDPVPVAYSTGTVTKMTKKTDLVILNLGFDTPLAHRGTCAEQNDLGSCRYIDIPQRSRTVIANVNFIKVPRSAINARYSNNTVLKHFVMSENLSLSRNGTRNSTVPNANGLGESGTDRIYDGYFRQGAGRLFGKPSIAGNNWYGFLASDEDQSQIGDPVTGYTNAGATVHDTGNFYTGSLVTDDAVFPVYQNNSERLWFYHDCSDGFSDNSAPNVFESSEIEGPILVDSNCVVGDNSRYHTFYRLMGVDAAADIDFDAGAGIGLPYSNWIMVKANDRQMSTDSKTNNLTLYNLSVSRDSNAGTGADYVSIGDETGSSTLSTCGSRDMPPSVVLRQSEPPCWWCSEYGTAGDNYGWNGGWDYGACDSATSPDLPAKRRFQSVACTAPPTCVDY